jgi:hypothetical protein
VIIREPKSVCPPDREAQGRRRSSEVEFGDAPVRVEIYASEETVEIFIEADFEALPEERRRFALLNIPRHLFATCSAKPPPQWRDGREPFVHPRRDQRCRSRGLFLARDILSSWIPGKQPNGQFEIRR